MPYTYDVFISYRRDPLGDEWLTKHFVPQFDFRVRDAIAAKCRRMPAGIFFDQTKLSPQTRKWNQSGIEIGEDWQTALKEALRQSRCLVAIWSPLYFFSSWCLLEWKSFEARQASRSLVVPAVVHDGESFPDEAKALQFDDLSEFRITGDGFPLTPLHVQFQQRVMAFAARVADAVSQAPEFGNWDVVELPKLTGELKIEQQRL